ncbi:MAG: ATP-binding protein [Anaerostipes sp.]|uniref:ATP-binding protein n=1 Tax=Anaerostipes sp. TaxID=1872530 RepID=UPI003992645F
MVALIANKTVPSVSARTEIITEENGVLYPTVTGMLLIGKEERLQEVMPTAKASFQVLEGTQVRVNEQFAKPLLATFELFENYLKAWNPEREMEYGLFRIPIPEFSESAFREGLVNAFCHRDYSILQMVRLAIEDEGLSISSPGGFIKGVNLNNLLSVEPHGRNQALADALKRIGLADIIHISVARTRANIERLLEIGLVEATGNGKARAYILSAKVYREQDNSAGYVRQTGIDKLKYDELVLKLAKQQGYITRDNVSELLNISNSQAYRILKKLADKGKLVLLGKGRSARYKIL